MTVDELLWYYNRLAKDLSDEITARKQVMQREKSRVAAAKYRR